jgi:hypothetical protein
VEEARRGGVQVSLNSKSNSHSDATSWFKNQCSWHKPWGWSEPATRNSCVPLYWSTRAVSQI